MGPWCHSHEHWRWLRSSSGAFSTGSHVSWKNLCICFYFIWYLLYALIVIYLFPVLISYSYIVVIINARPTDALFTSPALRGRNLNLHPIQVLVYPFTWPIFQLWIYFLSYHIHCHFLCRLELQSLASNFEKKKKCTFSLGDNFIALRIVWE